MDYETFTESFFRKLLCHIVLIIIWINMVEGMVFTSGRGRIDYPYIWHPVIVVPLSLCFIVLVIIPIHKRIQYLGETERLFLFTFLVPGYINYNFLRMCFQKTTEERSFTWYNFIEEIGVIYLSPFRDIWHKQDTLSPKELMLRWSFPVLFITFMEIIVICSVYSEKPSFFGIIAIQAIIWVCAVNLLLYYCWRTYIFIKYLSRESRLIKFFVCIPVIGEILIFKNLWNRYF